MNKFFLIILVVSVFCSCDERKHDKIIDDSGAQEERIKRDSLAKVNTTVQVVDSVYKFGKVKDGDTVKYSFNFKNIGNKPLIVESVSAQCGCTVPEKPEKPIMPGETGVINVVFNSTNKTGHVEKKVTVIANTTPKFPYLMIEGEVVKP